MSRPLRYGNEGIVIYPVRKLIDFALRLLFPPRCIGCAEVIPINQKDGFCPACRIKWEELKRERCRRCGQPIAECWCGVPRDRENTVDHEFHLVQYDKSDGIVKSVLYRIKEYKCKEYFDTIGREMYEELYFRLDYDDLVVAWVPRTPHMKKRFGHDQSEELAKIFCSLSDLESVDVLYNIGKKAQKQLAKKKRQQNAERSYRIRSGISNLIKGKNVILIDDVVTTGATASRCAGLLKSKGAERVIVLCVAKTV